MSPEVISLDLVLSHLGLRHLYPELISQHRDSPRFSLSCQKHQKLIFEDIVFTALNKNQPLVGLHESSLTQNVFWNTLHTSPHLGSKSLLCARTGTR